MVKKTSFLLVLTLCSMLLVFTAGCKQEGTEKSNKTIIGISKVVSHPALDAVEQGIQDELTELGYTDLVYDLQNANGDPNAAKQIAVKFQNDKVKVAVGIATPTAQALAGTLKDIPVVFSAVTDPVGAGLVESVDRGSSNVTGVSDMTPVESQVELLYNMISLKRLGNVYASSEDNSIALAKLVKKACERLGITYVEATVTNSSEVKQAVESLVGKVDGIYLGNDNTVFSALGSVVDVANNNNIPIMSADPTSAETMDIFASSGSNYYMIGRETGKMVADLLKGKSTADMPTLFLKDPKTFDLVINLDVAKKIGITIPEKIRTSATKIIENGTVISQP